MTCIKRYILIGSLIMNRCLYSMEQDLFQQEVTEHDVSLQNFIAALSSLPTEREGKETLANRTLCAPFKSKSAGSYFSGQNNIQQNARRTQSAGEIAAGEIVVDEVEMRKHKKRKPENGRSTNARGLSVISEE
jgi:hypothetical protein